MHSQIFFFQLSLIFTLQASQRLEKKINSIDQYVSNMDPNLDFVSNLAPIYQSISSLFPNH